ncbi:MAG: putative LPS assembly protein LptD [Bacteroidia bacterium]|nr:putative LPS assembly protein LptD [Bacteroidia bacterium]
MYSKLIQIVAIFIWFPVLISAGYGQVSEPDNKALQGTGSTDRFNSRMKAVNDSLASRAKDKPKTDTVDSPIDYKAKDSIIFMVNSKMMYLYGDAQINYKNIELKANYIEIDLGNNKLYARGGPDSTGKISGKPHYKEGDDVVDASEMYYNFKTKKAYIINGFTKQQQGFLHSEVTKKESTDIVNIRNGKYTTCDLENPHYYIALTKAKVIPKDKIISGPAYLVIADVPTPIGIPFGFFPNKRENSSGILIPEYGEETNRGFFLRNGGYYFALSDYADLQTRADIYSKGTWGLKMHSNYKDRYVFNGYLDAQYYSNIFGEKGLRGYSTSKDFSLMWSHIQDSKANPTRTFSANVNISSTAFDHNNTYNSGSYLSNTKSSSISFSKHWGDIFNFSANLRHTQNSLDKTIDFTLPSLTFNMNRQYPFRTKGKTSDFKWYENIEVSYSSKLDNRLSTYDSLLFKKTTIKDFNNGFQHDIPVSANFKLLKFITLTPKVDYTGWLYSSHINKTWYGQTHISGTDTISRGVVTNTVHSLIYAQQVTPTLNLSISPTFYGMYLFRNSKIKAIRHVFNPTISFAFKPGMGRDNPAYYKTVQSDTLGNTQKYSIFDQGIYGGPISAKKYGIVSLNLGNNLEMKVKTPNDTVNEEKKIKILESFSISTSYDVFKDSMNWSPVTINGRTTLFKNLNITFGGTLDPYAIDSAGRRINQFEYDKNRSFGRLTDANLSLGFSMKAPEKKKSNDKQNQTGTTGQSNQNIPQSANNDYNPDYFDINIPWSIRVDYSWNYTKPAYVSKVTQTMRFSGDVNLTPKWKIGFSSGYDFDSKKMTYTTVDIYRDLHCWEMKFNWVPFGAHQMYSFSINVKASVLKDLKYQKQKSWFDNLQ